MSINIPIQGVTNPIGVSASTTSQFVGQTYQSAIQVFATIFNKRANQASYEFTDSDFQSLVTAYQNLVKLASGQVVDPTTGRPAVMNLQMAQSLNTLFVTLKASGLQSRLESGSTTATPSSEDFQALERWWDLAPAGLDNVINTALTASTSWQSIQAMIELSYVAQGNQIISNQLGSLQTGLELTNEAVNILTSLQNLHNKILPASVGSYNPGQVSGGNPQDFFTSYSSYTKNGNGSFVGFNNPIAVVTNTTSADQAEFNAMRSKLENLIPEMEESLGISKTDPDYPGSLPDILNKVLTDIKNNPEINKWIVDNQGSNSNINLAGDISRNLSEAQTASQSLNSQQQQNVQQALFLFQEFYQSASGMLQTISEIIRQMAQSAAR